MLPLMSGEPPVASTCQWVEICPTCAHTAAMVRNAHNSPKIRISRSRLPKSPYTRILAVWQGCQNATMSSFWQPWLIAPVNSPLADWESRR